MIDTHAHLDACDEQPGPLLTRAREVGVTRVITIGTGIESSYRAVEIADAHTGVYAAVGIDPHRAGRDGEVLVDDLRALFASERAVAVGETGLDYRWGRDTKPEQARLFAAQLELARELRKPVVIHCREAAHETADALAAFDGTVVLHCFSEPDLLEHALERGYYVSFAGNVTYPKSTDLRDAAARVPDDRILAETDSPYLSPQPRRGRPNEPANVVYTLAVLAEARADQADALAARIDANAAAAFAL